jgi:hypothetical protein
MLKAAADSFFAAYGTPAGYSGGAAGLFALSLLAANITLVPA